ncbi:MAG: hypothetical protein B6D35_14350 [Candidatus Brocadia sp. UTAMX2]|jgi:hypothetical protein|nr:MAG: hypothetical protein B6D35_14350 [Candidatus Brocadia sp. UTAMX2]
MNENSIRSMCLTIKLSSQYHIGSGFGLGRMIDSLLKVDEDGMPVIPGSTVIGILAQGMFDLLRFNYLQQERDKICDYHKPGKTGVKLSCRIMGRTHEDSCLLCYFFGSPAQDGILLCQDFQSAPEDSILRHMMKSGKYSLDERRQVIREYASHRQNIRTGAVLANHFFVKEEGGGFLTFQGRIEFTRNIHEERLIYLAAAMKNVDALGQRKTRGKGACTIACDAIGSLIKQLP